MAPPPPPVLMDELIEEILLLFSPDDPVSLVRAGLVCRSWWHIVSDPRFGRRFREFHRRPSMLGVFCSVKIDDGQAAAAGDVALFVRTSACPPRADRGGSRVLDARHGRVLLHNTQAQAPWLLAIWDPITDEQRELPPPPERLHRNCVSWNAAVTCAAAAGPGGGTCDHLDCHGGPFLVVLSCIIDLTAYFCAYSSDTAIPSWSKPRVVHLAPLADEKCDVVGPSLLIGDTLHFLVGREILTYDLGRHRPSLISSPFSGVRNMVLVTTEEGGLGVAVLRGDRILLWSHHLAAWTEGSSLELVGMAEARLVGFAEGVDAVFVSEKGCIFMLELKSRRVTKVCDMHYRSPTLCREFESLPRASPWTLDKDLFAESQTENSWQRRNTRQRFSLPRSSHMRGLHCYGIVPYVSFYVPEAELGWANN